MQTIPILMCPFCGHKFEPRVDSPVSCPKCKRYFTDDKPAQRIKKG